MAPAFAAQAPPGGFASSTDTALCLIPPPHVWERIDRLRSLYDKGHRKWPPHINLVYPFVHFDSLGRAVELIQSRLDQDALASTICLTEASAFTQKSSNTLYLRPSPDSETQERISRVANLALEAIGRPSSDGYNPHMTIGQSDDVSTSSHKFLMEKLRLLTPIEWESARLAVLVRHKATQAQSGQGSSKGSLDFDEMRLWGYIEPGNAIQRLPVESQRLYGGTDDESSDMKAISQPTYKFQESTQSWTRYEVTEKQGLPTEHLDRLIVASYNVLAEFEWPPSSERYPGLVRNVLSRRAAADILVLQEVTDTFLTELLADPEVRSRYPYSSQGPPSQPEIGPLPSHLNLVVLSIFPLRWSHLPSNRKHKGAVVATFPSLTEAGTLTGRPLVLAACHFSHGLNDGAVNASRSEVQGLLQHLSTYFENHAWIIAGDFNLTTSAYTLNMACQRGDLSSRSHDYLRNFNPMLAEHGLQDTWLMAKILSGESSASGTGPGSLDDLHEGEQGATFDPLSNALTASMVGSGLNNRPQRYDRIFVNDQLHLRPRRFNLFGFGSVDGNRRTNEVVSDHWGIRCLLEAPSTPAENVQALPTSPIHIHRSPHAFGGLEDIKNHLDRRNILPNVEDAQQRKTAIRLLEKVLQCEGTQTTQNGPRMLLVPVGSFAMGCWTATSDVDCLCIGEISSRTFFSLATQRLRKAASEGITILRRVKATSGTMLELDVQGIKFDLQYCAAPSLLEEFPDVFKRPSTDPAFALPPSVLSKLKPLRDLSYIQRSIPDMTQYTIAHLFLSTWAKHRGLYGAKFGLLGSVHITVLLVPICKTLALESASVSVGDVISTFFHHYASFDWKKYAVFDPFFHESLKYHRTFREPLCLLGWHGPSLNTAANASNPTAMTLAEELRRVDERLGDKDLDVEAVLGPAKDNVASDQPLSVAVTDFLHQYRSYIQVSVHYWGSSSTAGAKFVGWLESRCVMLLVDMDRKVPSLAARIWPARFTAEAKSEEDDAGSSCHGCYLIGLTWQADQGSKEDVKLIEGSLQTVLRHFETRIRGDERYYDANTCWMSADVVRQDEVASLHLDHYHPADSLGDHGMSEDEELSDDEEEDEEDETVAPLKLRANQDDTNASVPGKFRTAKDVLNRIRWDAALDSSDYVVGYEDRFVGPREKALEEWKSEQTHEEFIPQHRILYFKRRSDDVVVWERRSRVDDVFGSGVTAASE